MAVRRPTLDQLRSVAEDLGMHMGDEELKSYDALMQANFAAYEAVDAMPDYIPAVKYPRTPGYHPEPAENKHNAWYVKTTIKGAPSGKLAGKTIALKDNICLAGVPMMNGASTLAGYVPDLDATIVTRILDAGGTIVGKTACEYFCFSGGNHTSSPLPGRHPPLPARAGPQPAADGLLGRRLVVGQRGRGRGGRGADGDRRRPGRLDPHAVELLRHLRDEADARARPLHRHHADRAHDRPHRPDDRDRRGQRALPRGAGGARRARPTAVRAAQARALYSGAGAGGEGVADRDRDRGLRAPAVAARGRRAG